MPTENRSSNIPRNLNTAEGGRGYIADLFRNRLGTYSYDRYITERLAADFSCALAAWLDPLLKKLDFLESREATPADGLSVELYAVTLERDILLMQVAEREALLEKVLANAERGLPPDLHRELRALLPGPPPQKANEAERPGFEAWHCRRFATKHTTGAPTRDMHNGGLAPNYGAPNQQQMWEAWQARAALSINAEPQS